MSLTFRIDWLIKMGNQFGHQSVADRQQMTRNFVEGFVRNNEELRDLGFFNLYFQHNLFRKATMRKTMLKKFTTRLINNSLELTKDQKLKFNVEHRQAIIVSVQFFVLFSENKGKTIISPEDSNQTLELVLWPHPEGMSSVELVLPNMLFNSLNLLQSSVKGNSVPVVIRLQSKEKVTKKENEIDAILYLIGYSKASQKYQVFEEIILSKQKAYTLVTVFGGENEEVGDKNTDKNIEEYGRESNPLCSVCFYKRPNCLFLPCKHYGMCYQCSKTLQNSTNKCPLCREVVKEIIRVFNH